MESLHVKRLPAYLISIVKSYLNERSLLYGESDYKKVTGVRPTAFLWNLMYDDLL